MNYFKRNSGWLGPLAAVVLSATLIGTQGNATSSYNPVSQYSPYQSNPVTAPANGYQPPWPTASVNTTLPTTVLDGVITGHFTAAAVSAAGIGYVIGDYETLTDGGSTNAVVHVTHVQAVSAAVVGVGSGGSPGATTCTGTTGTGTQFQFTSTIAGDGTLTSAAMVLSVAGDYTVMVTTPTAVPVSCTASLTGVTLNVVFGAKTGAVTTAGVGVTLASTTVATGTAKTGVGVGATWTVTAAVDAQALPVAGANGWKVYNPAASAHPIWVTDNGVTPTANGPSSMLVAALSGVHTENGESPPGNKLMLLGNAVGDVFIARVW